MMRRLSLVLFLGGGIYFSGCSAIIPLTEETEKDLEALQVSTPRMEIVAQFGSPAESKETMEGGKRDTYKFKDGYPRWSNLMRSFTWGAADLVTCFLWEVVGTPLELGVFAPEKMMADIQYDSQDRVAWGVIYNSEGKKVREVGEEPSV